MIIKNGYVVTMDGELRVYRDGAIVFIEGRARGRDYKFSHMDSV